eukprot:Skav224838  [mRNA]  locus=scaffold3408:251645:257563:+ [translate_table: standard]
MLIFLTSPVCSHVGSGNDIAGGHSRCPSPYYASWPDQRSSDCLSARGSKSSSGQYLGTRGRRPYGYPSLRARSCLVLLLLPKLCVASESSELDDGAVRLAEMQEIDLDLKDIRRHNDAMSRLLAEKVPFSQETAQALSLEARAEKRAELRLVKVFEGGFRNSTANATEGDGGVLACAGENECTWWERTAIGVQLSATEPYR